MKEQRPFADLNGVAVRQPLLARDRLAVDDWGRPNCAARPALADKAQAMPVLGGQRLKDQMGRRNGGVAEQADVGQFAAPDCGDGLGNQILFAFVPAQHDPDPRLLEEVLHQPDKEADQCAGRGEGN